MLMSTNSRKNHSPAKNGLSLATHFFHSSEAFAEDLNSLVDETKASSKVVDYIDFISIT